MPDIIIDSYGKKLIQLKPMRPTHVLKEVAPAIAPYLCFIFQQSLDLGEVPPDWKHANICTTKA